MFSNIFTSVILFNLYRKGRSIRNYETVLKEKIVNKYVTLSRNSYSQIPLLYWGKVTLSYNIIMQIKLNNQILIKFKTICR